MTKANFFRFLSLLACAMTLAGSEEFNGPFATWVNAKAAYGAKGDGIADDTAALQAALTDLGTPGHNPCLYVPPGTYRITSQLNLSYRQGISIIGDDPATTTIQWAGSSGGTMLWLNGVCYSRFSRLTFDGGGAISGPTASVLVDQSWDGTQICFDTGNEYTDDVFRGAPAGIGIRGGNLGFGFAETTVRRAKFLSLQTGIALKNFNALDLWVWDSLFDHNFTGITNSPGAGNWRVYNSVFRNSSNSDNHIGNTGLFSFIDNYSVGSGAFIGAEGNCGPALLTIQHNQINSIGTPVWGSPITNGNQGPLVILDNQIGNASAAGVNAWSWCSDSDVLSAGNQFAAATGETVQGRLNSIDDQTSQALTFTEPILPPTLAKSTRMVIEVPVVANGAAIQQAINSAAAAGKAVVHLAPGTYSAGALTVPPSDVQIVGDGMFATRINGSIQIQGPSTATVSELWTSGNQAGDGVAISGVDQPGARLYLDGPLLGGSAVNLFYDGLTNLTVDGRSISHSGGTPSMNVSGAGLVTLTGVASFGLNPGYQANGGRLIVRDEWYDSGGTDYLRASGSTVSVAGSHIAGSTPTTLGFNGGNVTVVGSQITSQSALTAMGTGTTFAGGLVGTAAAFFNAPGLMVNSKSTAMPATGEGSAQVPNVGTYDPAVVRAGLSQLRATQPGPINDLPSGVSDIRLHRVQISGFANGIHLLPGGSAPPTPPTPPAPPAPTPALLTITKTHTGNFQRKGRGTYTVTVSNSGGPTTGTVTVTDTLPSGLALMSMSGAGWSCSSATCSRSDVLQVGANYPALTVTVRVATKAASPQVNRVSVSGGGSVTASANDSTVIGR